MAVPKNCKVSAGIVAAIVTPPGIPAANDNIDVFVVLFFINEFAILSNLSIGIPAVTGSVSIAKFTIFPSFILEPKVCKRNCPLSTLTPGTFRAVPNIVSNFVLLSFNA